MLFKIQSENGKTEYAQAESILHLLKSYANEFSAEDFQNITEVDPIPDEEAKTIKLHNTSYTEGDLENTKYIMLYDLAVGNDFVIIASNDTY
ncbi:MAG: hypothetical protein V4538_01660 [Bacteroidota bacterium]